MGVDAYSLPFLVECVNRGCSLESTGMIGRQMLYGVDAETLAVELGKSGKAVSRERAAAMLAEADGYLEPILRFLGASRIESVDYSDYEKASVVHDMNSPVPDELKGQFTCVLDGGSLEHVFNFPQAVKNCMEMLAVGGTFLSITPANNFMGHGFYQFSPELFYRILSEENGFAIREMILCEADAGAPRHRVRDPRSAGGRVTLINRIPTTLMLMATKTHFADIFRVSPQQSDYEPKWTGAAEPDRAVAAEGGSGLLKSLMPYPVRKFVRRFRSSPDPFASEAFERMP